MISCIKFLEKKLSLKIKPRLQNFKLNQIAKNGFVQWIGNKTIKRQLIEQGRSRVTIYVQHLHEHLQSTTQNKQLSTYVYALNL